MRRSSPGCGRLLEWLRDRLAAAPLPGPVRALRSESIVRPPGPRGRVVVSGRGGASGAAGGLGGAVVAGGPHQGERLLRGHAVQGGQGGERGARPVGAAAARRLCPLPAARPVKHLTERVQGLTTGGRNAEARPPDPAVRPARRQPRPRTRQKSAGLAAPPSRRPPHPRTARQGDQPASSSQGRPSDTDAMMSPANHALQPPWNHAIRIPAARRDNPRSAATDRHPSICREPHAYPPLRAAWGSRSSGHVPVQTGVFCARVARRRCRWSARRGAHPRRSARISAPYRDAQVDRYGSAGGCRRWPAPDSAGRRSALFEGGSPGYLHRESAAGVRFLAAIRAGRGLKRAPGLPDRLGGAAAADAGRAAVPWPG